MNNKAIVKLLDDSGFKAVVMRSEQAYIEQECAGSITNYCKRIGLNRSSYYTRQAKLRYILETDNKVLAISVDSEIK